MDTVKNFFKYVDASGASAILEDGTLLFSSPLYFNDPFDISIQTLFGYDPFNFEDFLNEFLNLAFSSEEIGSPNNEPMSQLFNFLRLSFKNCSPEYKNQVREELLSQEIWNKKNLIQSTLDALGVIKTAFECSGVFCASKRFDNYLLWSHYADKHQGVVLEFVPNIEKDSMLRLMETVKYSSTRPMLYKSIKEYLIKSMFRERIEVLNEYAKEITTTKSIEWVYEEEVRLYMPIIVNIFEGKRNHCLKYHDDELRAIYLGCKIDIESRSTIIKLAKNRNKDVRIFDMIPDHHQYKITPKLIEWLQ